MRIVQRFEANDGEIFDTEEECLKHEKKMYWRNKIYEAGLHRGDADDIYDWIVKYTKGFKHVDIP